jgi:tetratricopeptide (TPR) repeat protein
MFKRIAAVSLSLLLCTTNWAQSSADNAAGDAALAERFASMAQQALSDPNKANISDADWQQALALYQIASKLSPSEPRYVRLVAEAQLKTGDRHGALESFRNYSKLDKSDLTVLIQIIDLYSAEMETADAKLKYFEDLLTKGLAPEVNSRIATRAARLRAERSEQDESLALIEQALKADPLNPEALAMKYQTTRSGTPVDRFALLLQMIRANPRQPEVMLRVGDELAAAGLPGEAASWYMLAIQLNARLGQPPELGYFDNYCSSLALAGQGKFARATADQVLAGLPTNPDMHFLKLLIDKTSSDAELQKQTMETATGAMLENIYVMHRKVMGGDSPTTKPTGELAERLPDLNALVTKAKSSDDEAVINALAQTLTDIAWLQIYFAKAPQNAGSAIEALKTLLPADNVTVPRLEGWAFLVAGKNDEARVKLSAVADRDVLSKMGLIRLDAATNPEQAKSDASKLVLDNGNNLLGVLLLDGLKEVGGAVVAATDAPALKEKLDAFPKKWLEILDKPQDFYVMRADAFRIAHQYDEPMLAKIELSNNSEFDLTIGDNGTVRPDWWFDCSIRAGQTGNIPGAAYGRLAKRYVLRRGETMQQVIRLDQYPKLAPALAGNPVFAMQLYFTVLTNPTPTGAGVAPGPAGYRLNLRSVIERSGLPINNPQTQQKLMTTLSSGDPAAKMRTISALAELAQGWSKEESPQPAKDMAKRLLEAVDDTRGDPVPSVRGWAMYRAAMLRSSDPRKQGVTQMLADPNWAIRALGIVVAGSLPPDQAQQVLESAKADAEPVLASLAKSTEVVNKHAATQPTTQASSQPSSQPATDPLPGFNLGK